ncbi:hypothetical protein WA171_004563 [Blastocystis sp. BT1]
MEPSHIPAESVAECSDDEINRIETLTPVIGIDYADNEERLNTMADAFRTILRCIGEDPEREGLRKTPMRAAQAMLFCCQGYSQNLESVINNAVFEDAFDDMIIVKDIPMFSMCEHHLLPFYGKVHIGYIPKGKVLGLSKLARIAEISCRRLQLQERITREIAENVMKAVDCEGVGVVVEAEHMCMCMRGVQKVGSRTITSAVLGTFRRDPRTRGEFFSNINHH